MQHAIARQAEAERERRAKIINAEGEFQAAAKLAEAAEVIGENPVTLQLRYLQTLREIGATQNSTIVFPMPIDLVSPVLDAARNVPSRHADGGDNQVPRGDNQVPRELHAAGHAAPVLPAADADAPELEASHAGAGAPELPAAEAGAPTLEASSAGEAASELPAAPPPLPS